MTPMDGSEVFKLLPVPAVDPDLQRILDALGIPEADSLHEILERIAELRSYEPQGGQP